MSAPTELMFAVTREDPELEILISEEIKPKSILMVASGGCLPFQIKYMFPEISVSAFDFNPRQIEHCRLKARKISDSMLGDLNIDDHSPNGLSQCGRFESMFRRLRLLFLELLSSSDEMDSFFSEKTSQPDRESIVDAWVSDPSWPTVFDTIFCDRSINTMFDKSATQHALPESMPGYFMDIFERGLRHDASYKNPWLQSIFLGKYIRDDSLSYLRSGKAIDVEFISGTLLSVPDISSFQLVSLSNIFDWSSDQLVDDWSSYLMGLRKGSYITIRQLNNERDLSMFFDRGFDITDRAGGRSIASILKSDRSLFYNSLSVLVRR